MPPFLPRKRAAEHPPPPEPSRSRPTKKLKATGVLHAPAKDPPSSHANRQFTLAEDSDSSLSDLESDEFEDVPEHSKAEDHDDGDWEDALEETSAPQPTGDLELTLSKDAAAFDYGAMKSYGTTKKGPSKIERQIRVATHRMHVQCLLFHNAIRNMWASDTQTHQILLKQLSPGILQDVHRWKVASGLLAPEPAEPVKKRGRKSKGARDWGTPSKRVEGGKPDMSRGDPLIPLLKTLVADWRKRFKISAPGLRKHGYKPKQVLQAEIASFHNDSQNPEIHGERIRNVSEFRARARQMTGSRDVGAQLFTALLRALSIESRLVTNLQPIGFGWTKAEEATLSKPTENDAITQSSTLSDDDDDDNAHQHLNDDESDDASVLEVTAPNHRRKKYDTDLPFPVYWTETISPISNAIVAVSPFLANSISLTQDTCVNFQPTGAKAEKVKQVMAYVVGFSGDGTAKDVTTRYLKGRRWPGKTKGFRLPAEKIPIYNKRGKILRHENYDWFKHTMRGYRRPKRTAVDDVEDSTDLVPQQPERKDIREEGDTLQSLRSSADFVLERFLRREEALRPGSGHVRMFTHGKGDKAKEEKVFRRDDVVPVKTAESWHKEGRRIKPGEIPLKLAPIRAVTLTRKREVEEEMRETGEKPMQGLYSVEQTEYIIPPPIKDGVIPRNAYGNIDCFVPSMVPEGAVHLPYRGTVRMCKKLEIDFAEAVIGFEFGNKRAVPVIQGVVVAQENQQAVLEALEVYEAEQRKKEESKQEKTILSLWRKMLMGLRIAERMQDEYGADNTDPRAVIDLTGDLKGVGGRQLREAIPGSTEDPKDSELKETGQHVGAGGFLLHDEDEAQPEELVMEAGHSADLTTTAAEEYPTPLSAPTTKLVRTRKSMIVESEASELSEPESGKNSDLDTEVRERRSASPLTSPSSEISNPRAGRRKGNAAKATKKEHRQAPKTKRSKNLSSEKMSTPRQQQPRRAKGVLTSPYFDLSDTDD